MFISNDLCAGIIDMMGTIRKIKLSIKWLFGNVPIRVTTKEGNSTSWRRLVIIGDFNNYYWGHHPPCKKTAPYPPTKPAVTIQVPKKRNEPTVIRSTVSCAFDEILETREFENLHNSAAHLHLLILREYRKSAMHERWVSAFLKS